MKSEQPVTGRLSEVEMLQKTIKKYEKMIEDLSAPLIPSIVPDTILVPLTGLLTVDRFSLIQDRIVHGIGDKGIETVIIDFTAVNIETIEENMTYGMLSQKINELVSVLSLMGTETMFVGFSPSFAQHLIRSRANGFNELCTFATFRAGLNYLLDLKGLEIVAKKR